MATAKRDTNIVQMEGHQESEQIPSSRCSSPPSAESSSSSLHREYGYCTFAVTGAHPYFQAIYVCHACCSSSSPAEATEDDNDDSFEQQQEPQHLCVCQACAQTCHRHDDDEKRFSQDNKEFGEDNDDNRENDDVDIDDDEVVEYIGMGPSYCDCPSNTKHPCRIAHASQQEAQRLQIQPGQLHRTIFNNYNNYNKHSTQVETAENNNNEKRSSSCTNFVRDVFTIPVLQHDNEALVRLLRRQAETLVNQHSKETFWIDYHHPNQSTNDDDDLLRSSSNSGSSGNDSCCALESLAWAVARNHIQHYAASSRQDELVLTHEKMHGMEWWVQVKHVDLLRGVGCTDQQQEDLHEEQGIELHYDKDEAVAESFSLGVFPVLSTVTYLCEPTATMREAISRRVPPTLVFSHCYDSTYNVRSSSDNDDDSFENNNMTNIPDMLVSHAAPGKHLAFDGRLLHGSPAHVALRPPLYVSMTNAHGDIVFDAGEQSRATKAIVCNNSSNIQLSSSLTRITFLVNLWTHQYKPAGVHVLPDHIRQSLFELEQQEDELQHHSSTLFWDKDKPWQCKEIASLELIDETIDLPLELCGRIELPFVGNINTLDKHDQEEEEEESMVVVTFPPPPFVQSTMRVHFGPGLQAYLDSSSSSSSSTHKTNSDERQQDTSALHSLPASLARFCEQQTLETGFTSTTTCAASTSETAFI